MKKYIEVSARAHGSLSIDDEDLLSLPIPLPSGGSSRIEQQKIAACLTSLDEIIAAHDKKLDAFKSHKKGLMQQLFPRGRNPAQPPFPRISRRREWESVKWERLSCRQARMEHATESQSHMTCRKGIPFIMASDLDDGQIDTSNCHFIRKALADTLKKSVQRKAMSCSPMERRRGSRCGLGRF